MWVPGRRVRPSLCGALALLIACGGETADDAGDGDAGAVRPAETPVVFPDVTILTPADGETLGTVDVRVTLAVEGIEIAPVAEGRLDTAHHHLFLDTDLTPPGEMVPLDHPQIIHMGDGRAEHTFTGLGPGEHRVIAVLADPTHTPLDPPATDTVIFRVGG